MSAQAQTKVIYCRKGHAMTPENSYPRKDGYVACRRCGIEANRRYMIRRKQLRLPLEVLYGG